MYIYIVSNYSSMVLQLGSLALSNQSLKNLMSCMSSTQKTDRNAQIQGGETSNIVHFHPKTSGLHDPIWLAHIFQMGGKKPAPSNLFAMENMEGNTFSAWKKYFLKLSSERLVSLHTLCKNLKYVSRKRVRHPYRWHRNRYWYFKILFLWCFYYV